MSSLKNYLNMLSQEIKPDNTSHWGWFIDPEIQTNELLKNYNYIKYRQPYNIKPTKISSRKSIHSFQDSELMFDMELTENHHNKSVKMHMVGVIGIVILYCLLYFS